MGYCDWGLLMLFVYLRPPLYPMEISSNRWRATALKYSYEVYMFIFVYIACLCFINIRIYVCMYVFFLFIICPCISKYYNHTLIVYGCMCVTCFFCCALWFPHLVFFFLPFQNRGFPVGQLTWKSWHGKVWNPVILHAKTTKKKFFVDVSRTWTLIGGHDWKNRGLFWEFYPKFRVTIYNQHTWTLEKNDLKNEHPRKNDWTNWCFLLQKRIL